MDRTVTHKCVTICHVVPVFSALLSLHFSALSAQLMSLIIRLETPLSLLL